MKRGSHLLRLILWTSFLTIVLYPYAAPAQTCEKPVAKVVSVQGTVESQRGGDTQWQPVQLNDTYCPGDTIRVQDRSRADVALMNQSVLRLNANTTLTLEAVKEERTSVVNVIEFERGTGSAIVLPPMTSQIINGTFPTIQEVWTNDTLQGLRVDTINAYYNHKKHAELNQKPAAKKLVIVGGTYDVIANA